MSAVRAPAAVLVALVIAAGLASVASSDERQTRTIILTVRHSRFSISELDVNRGETVKFVVRNTDPIDHELIVGPTSVQRRHESGREAWHPPVPGEVSVPLFGRASTTYTFDEGGTVWFGCHLPGHWSYGMKGRIDVS